ncbi:hypothetical protein OSTOST_07506 [Ostertagia ostertagi]
MICTPSRQRDAEKERVAFFAALLSEREFQESRFLQLQLASSNAELIFSKVMSFLNTGDFDMTGCTSEQMLAVANECQILSLQERSREGFQTPLPKPVSHYPLAAASAPLPCPVPIFSPVPNPFLLMDLQSQIHAANLLQMMMTQLHSVNPPQEILDDKVVSKQKVYRENRRRFHVYGMQKGLRPIQFGLLSRDNLSPKPSDQESRFLQLQLASSNAELIFSKVMSFLNTGDFDMTGCTSEQMLAVANECQILSLQERSREGFQTPLPKPVSHYPLAAASAPLPCPVPIFSPFRIHSF